MNGQKIKDGAASRELLEYIDKIREKQNPLKKAKTPMNKVYKEYNGFTFDVSKDSWSALKSKPQTINSNPGMYDKQEFVTNWLGDNIYYNYNTECYSIGKLILSKEISNNVRNGIYSFVDAMAEHMSNEGEQFMKESKV
jgi:hypothetical protein